MFFANAKNYGHVVSCLFHLVRTQPLQRLKTLTERDTNAIMYPESGYWQGRLLEVGPRRRERGTR